MRTFADIPAHVRQRVQRGEPILLILLDAFGRVFLERHLEHPLIRRLEVVELASQFPSTTTAHVTTLHFGLPVTEHGLYEWAVYEPSLQRIINPLPFRLAGDDAREGLAGRLEPSRLLDTPTFYDTIGVPAVVIQPEGIHVSSYSRLACAGAELRGSDDLASSVQDLVRELGEGRIGYGHIYWPDIDTASHCHGPDSLEVTATILEALDAIRAALDSAPAGVTVMLTADHGHTAVSPARVDLLDELWPELTGHLSQPRPAGSARDPFLHVHPGAVDHVIEQLSSRLGDRAEVRRAEAVFAEMGPRLAARLADVVVLPADGRCAWLAAAPTHVLENLGSHGGSSEAETATYLAELRT